MLHEFGSPANEIIETGLNLLQNRQIVPPSPWKRTVVTYFARRNIHLLKNPSMPVPEQETSKIKTLFGVKTKDDFSGPSYHELIGDISVAFDKVKPEFIGLQGLLLYGSRLNQSKTPRNTWEFPSDIDAIAIFKNSLGDFVSREQLQNLSSQISQNLTLQNPVYKHIPLSLTNAERAGSIYSRLNPRYFHTTPPWAAEPDSFYYIGELRDGKKRQFTQTEANQLISQSVSSPEFQDLRVREIKYLYNSI